MQIPVSSQAEYDQIVKARKHLGNELVIQNSKEFITVKTNVTVGKDGRCKTNDDAAITITVKENGVVAAQGKTTVVGHDHANIIAKGNCKVTLHDSAFGTAFEHCHITLKNSSKINASGNCTVHAHDQASVSAAGNSKVYTYQKATAKGTDVTALSGKDESTLIGNKNCTIKAKDNCIVYASENCTVQAANNCLVVADSFAKIKSQDNCLVMSKGKPEITLLDKCEHLKLDEVNDKNIMGALKQIAHSKAVNSRPYDAIQIIKDNIPPQKKAAVENRLKVMGLKDQTAAKDYLYNIIEVDSPVKKEPGNIERQLETANKAGYVQGVGDSILAIQKEQNMVKKLLTETEVTREMLQKYANPETFKKLEQGVFAQQQDQKIEQTQGVKR